MNLIEVKLINWRSYKLAKFDFPIPDSPRNVILIGAQNGTGKTSLLIALYLGLFGRQAMHLIEGIRIGYKEEDKALSYKSLLERIIHRSELKSESPIVQVELTFNTIWGKVKIQRIWHFSRGGKLRDINSRDTEEVLIYQGEYPEAMKSWEEANDKIAELLFHPSVMPCFFFDGEQAQERVEAAGGRAMIDAVNTLYGTGLLNELNSSLKTFIQNEQIRLRRDHGVVKLDELNLRRNELDRNKEDLESTNNFLNELKKKRDTLEQERTRCSSEIQRLVGDRASDIEQYADRIKVIDIRLNKAREDLVKGLTALSLPLSMVRHSSKIKSVIESEQIRHRWLLLKEEARGKAQSIIDNVFTNGINIEITPPLSVGQVTQLRNRLEKALEALWSPPPKDCANNFTFTFLTESERASILSKMIRVNSLSVRGLVEVAYNWERLNSENREIRQQFDKIRIVQPKLKELKEEIDRLNGHVRECDNDIYVADNRSKGILSKIKDLKAQIGQMEVRRELTDPVQAKLDVAQRVRTVIDEAKDALIPLCKASLEERCTLHFSKMISNEFINFKVSFDPGREPLLISPSGYEIFVSSLSGAQKRAFGLAFTLAVADLSGQTAPIVIDTPVGNMDSEYRARVLMYVSEAAKGQVIFLSHDKEISPEYLPALKSKILKNFLITFEKIQDGTGISNIRENAYFGEA